MTVEWQGHTVRSNSLHNIRTYSNTTTRQQHMQHVCTTASTATSFASNIFLLSKSTHSKCSLNYSSTTAPEQQQLCNSSATAPQQLRNSSRTATAPQQLQNSSATAPQKLCNSFATVLQQLSQLNNTSIKSCSTFQINSTYRASATTATLSTPMVLIAISTAATTLA